VVEYDRVKKEGGIFTEYVNMFMKLKTEVNCWPKWCNSEEQRNKYIKEYYEREGVQFYNSKMSKKNKARKSICKLKLNCLWGKFAQNENMDHTVIIRDPAKFCDKLTDSNIDVAPPYPLPGIGYY